MTLTADAMWLNTFFSGFDAAILGVAHKLAVVAGSILTPICKLITLLGEKGLLFFILAVILMLFPRWRKTGVCIFGAVCCGALITNIILKDLIARPRPFESVETFREWWQFIGSPAEDGFSFPSGHVTAAAAGVTGLCLMRGKRWVLPGALWVLLMMFSRNYLMAHYPSDVLFALLIGIFSGFVAAGITKLIFRFLEKHSGEGRFYDFVLEAGIGDSGRSASGGQPIRIKKTSSRKDENAAVASSGISTSPSVTAKHVSPASPSKNSAQAARDNYVGKH